MHHCLEYRKMYCLPSLNYTYLGVVGTLDVCSDMSVTCEDATLPGGTLLSLEGAALLSCDVEQLGSRVRLPRFSSLWKQR